MPFRPTLPRRCRHCHDSKLTSFLSAAASLADPSPPAGAVPAAPTPAAYNALMSAYSRAGRPDEVLRVFRSLPFPPSAPLFTTLISSLAESGHHRAAQAAFSSLIVSGLRPTASVVTAMLKARGPLSANRMCEVLFLSLKAARCVPDAAAYNCIISAFCDEHLVQEALGVLEAMLDDGIRPTVSSYTAVLHVYCKQGRILEAERLVDTMIKVGCPPDVVSYSVLIGGLCSVGELGKVQRILEESEEKGWTPNAVTYNIYMSALCRMGWLDEVFRQLDIMRERGVSVTVETVHILFDCLCREARFMEAVSLLEYSKELGWDADVFCYNTLMSRLCDDGDFARVLKLLVDLLKKGIGPDMFSFTIAIRSLCGAGKFKVAKCLLDYKGIEYDTKAFNTLIHGFWLVSNLDEVHLTFMDMLLRKIEPDDFTISVVIGSLCKKEMFMKGIDVLIDCSEKCLFPNRFFQLSNWLVKAQRLGDLIILLRRMRSKDLVIDVCLFSSLVRVFCWEGYCKHESFYEISIILDIMLECLPVNKISEPVT